MTATTESSGRPPPQTCKDVPVVHPGVLIAQLGNRVVDVFSRGSVGFRDLVRATTAAEVAFDAFEQTIWRRDERLTESPEIRCDTPLH